MKYKYVILGGGPTGLGAAYRLKELGITDFIVLEKEAYVGGLATSFVDEKGVMRQFSGRVNGAAMEGTLRTEGHSEEVRWNASKR